MSERRFLMRSCRTAAAFLALGVSAAANADPSEKMRDLCRDAAAAGPTACSASERACPEACKERFRATTQGAPEDAASGDSPAPATLETLGAEVVHALFDRIADRLQAGEQLKIPGFGTFSVRERQGRVGRNPRTGLRHTVPPERVIIFRAANELKRKLNLAEAAQLSQPGARSSDSDAEMGARSIDERLDAFEKDTGQKPDPLIDQPFLMPIEDVFTISGRGTVVTGRVERGVIEIGDEVEIVGLGDTRKTTVAGIEMFRKLLDRGEAGDNIGVLLADIHSDEVERGQVLAEPGSIKPHTRFEAEVYILTKEEGGRHTPFFSNYRPQFYFRTTDVIGTVSLPEGTEIVMPGDEVTLEVGLIEPVAIEENLRFAIREGGRTVGAGVVTRTIE